MVPCMQDCEKKALILLPNEKDEERIAADESIDDKAMLPGMIQA